MPTVGFTNSASNDSYSTSRNQATHQQQHLPPPPYCTINIAGNGDNEHSMSHPPLYNELDINKLKSNEQIRVESLRNIGPTKISS